MTSKSPMTTDYGALAGTVRDESGNPIAEAEVTARSESSNEAFTKITDRSGHFVFPALVPDRYDVVIEAAQYKTLMAEYIGVPPGQTQTVAYTLHAYTPTG